MLQNLHVKNLALIEEAEVEFQDGLNILSGETGAGKSIILGSIHLALGGKYNADMLRAGAEYGFVELTFFVENEKQAAKLKELDVYPEDGIVVLSRKLMQGRSISRVNGETVQKNQLKEIASLLIDIYGQHEHQTLLSKKNHLTLLDEYAKDELKDLKQEVKANYDGYKKCLSELEKAREDRAGSQKEMDFLEFEIAEIKNANLKPGEDEDLESVYRRMVNGKKIADHAQEAYDYTAEKSGVNASETLSRAIRALQEIISYDEEAGALYDQLSEVDSLLNDFNRELSEYCKTFEFSEEEFYEVEERLNEVNRLKSKYGNTIEEILAYCEEKEARLEKLCNFDAYLAGLEADYERWNAELVKSAKKLSEKRRNYADILEKEIIKGLKELNFLDVQFEIAIASLETYSASGNDSVEFMISMNPGEPIRPLSEVASGGELSRIMLAIKTVMAEKDEIETLIFDEIDVGISGRTAQKVSEKMAVIGKRHQVICITHLAQIAAMADAHFAIEKGVEDGHTKTKISLLNEEESIRELARILGGAEITDTVIKSALEMKELAKRVK